MIRHKNPHPISTFFLEIRMITGKSVLAGIVYIAMLNRVQVNSVALIVAVWLNILIR